MEPARKIYVSDMTPQRVLYLDALKKFSDKRQALWDAAAKKIQAQYHSGRALLVMLGVAATLIGAAVAKDIKQLVDDSIQTQSAQLADVLSIFTLEALAAQPSNRTPAPALAPALT